jgi:hypothetical protein
MNNCFAYDLVPTVEVIEAMIRAARRCNDFPTAVRAIEGVKVKVEKPSQYEAYLKELAPLMQELGTSPRLRARPHAGRDERRLMTLLPQRRRPHPRGPLPLKASQRVAMV